MGTHMIPRNTKGEGRILFIFSTKALICTVGGALIGIPFYYIFKIFHINVIGVAIVVMLSLLGFCIGTFKVPNTEAFKITRQLGGENIDDVLLRYIRFKRKQNKIYITKEEEKK